MNPRRIVFAVLLFVMVMFPALPLLAAQDQCIPYESAPQYIGKKVCVKGTLLRVSMLRSGTMYLNFCKDYHHCPFTVVVYRNDAQDIGDLRPLEGKEIRIEGKIRQYKGQAEIVMREFKQLLVDFNRVPLPAEFDAGRGDAMHEGAMPRKDRRGRAW